MAEQDEAGEPQVTITVVNHADGSKTELAASWSTTVADLVMRLYEALGLPPDADHRLICDGTGEDVLTHGRLDLAEYIEAGLCRERVWLLAAEGDESGRG
jgi:hypothetical protein